ncbi:hypothetical protein [uncultured Cyclobacterium sp.]|uniref:hypothetical protein n=1 Tax=uncultured Cyclobacterium sp. TaxID=453820 RepID=UPI0030EDB23E|tara:strand:+ start:27511 stop:27780 length:270 start_codon:yes stop_codon:yes gene_type:complete
MEKYVKNVWTYHLIVDIPIVFISYYWRDYRNTLPYFMFGVIIYPFLFRPIVDYYRLLALGEIEKKDFSKMWKWGGFYRFKYYSKLMFGI